MNAQKKSFIRFTACIAILFAFSFTVMCATNSYSKGIGQSSSDSGYRADDNANTKDEKIAVKSSGSSQRSSEVRTTQPEPRPANTNTPPPSSDYSNRNERPSNSGQRYSSPRNESAPNNTYRSPSNNGGNRSTPKDTRVQNDNPYNYRQPGNTNARDNLKRSDNTGKIQNPNGNDTRTKSSDTENSRQPNVSNDRNTWTRRDNQQGTDRNNNDSVKNNRGGINNNPSNVKDIRAKNDTGRDGSINRQMNPRDLPSTRNLGQGFKLPDDPRKSFRKEYEDIGSIWRQRTERRESHPDRDRGRGTNINIFINAPIYQGYCYDYQPLYSYPSVYCYYYDYFPPYIFGNRVHYYEPFEYRTRYNEITIFLNNPDNYYASDPSRRALDIALGDIEQSWEQKDIDRFMMYVRPKSSIAIFMKGDYGYSLDWLDYSDMTRDAMKSIDTKSFQFEKLTRRQRTGEITAYGRHKFYDWDGSLDTVYVRYTFERVSGEWYITEAETSDHKNW